MAVWSKTLLGGDNLIDVNNLATDPLAKPDRLSMARPRLAPRADRTSPVLRHRPFRFTWRGIDRVNVGRGGNRRAGVR